MQIAVGHFSTT